MARKRKHPIRILLDPRRYALILLIGLGAAFYLIYTSIKFNDLATLELTPKLLICLLFALVCIFLRDFAYMIRLKVLTRGELSWSQVFDVILLWEFGSSVTPSAVGGTPLAIFLLRKEGLNLGKSTSIVLVTAFLDELFFILMVPLCYFLIRNQTLFPLSISDEYGIAGGVEFLFYVSYVLIVLYCLGIGYGLFVNPHIVKKTLVKIFRLRLLKRWRHFGEKTGDEIIAASGEIRSQNFFYWLKAFGATFVSWTARYSVVNFLVLGFVLVDDHFLLYARQLIMWVVMLISPTPGSAGVAEFAFASYLGDFIPANLVGILALLWRIISYYLYIVAGIIILPRWLKKVFVKRKLIRFRTP